MAVMLNVTDVADGFKGTNNAFHIRGIHQLHYGLYRTISRDRNRKGATARESPRRMLVAPQLRFIAGYN